MSGFERLREPWIAIAVSAVILGASYTAGETHVGYDGSEYLVFAHNLVSTGQFSADGTHASCGRAPGYPVLLAGVLFATGDIRWAYPIQFLLLLAAFAGVGFAFRRLWPGSMGLSPLLACLWPLHQLARDLLSEPLFMALTVWAIVLLLRYLQTRDWMTITGAGALLGLSALVRPISLFAAPFFAIVLLWRRRMSIRHALLLCIVCGVAVGPWAIRNWIQFHRLIPIASNHGSIYYMTDPDVFWDVLIHSAGYSHGLPIQRELVGNDSELELAASDRYWTHARLNIAKDPWGFVGRCLLKTAFVWSYLPGTKGWWFTARWVFALGVVVQIGFLLLAGMGLRLARRESSPIALVLTSYVAYMTLALFPFYAESRFLLPVYLWLAGAACFWVFRNEARPISFRLRL